MPSAATHALPPTASLSAAARRLRNRLYYVAKPFLPRALRLQLRRWSIERLRRTTGSRWPILPGSEAAPAGWSGWPEGKRFAFVLTHDVEGAGGLERCRPLAGLELELGFRSSFNFIPEGTYSVTPELRDWLTRHGFEVGVHDLHHDGKLYSSHAGFQEHAARINHYLRAWGAVGFRSGFMLRQLDWLHALEIEYDLSSFDTDPFEPDPQGMNTIFPFWIHSSRHADKPLSNRPLHAESTPSAPAGSPERDLAVASLPNPASSSPARGYLELPYTLPQDSTLFLLLQETGIEIWKQKLAWLAEKGGMALLNVHPDYLAFDQASHSNRDRYPADRYREFLTHVRDTYAGQYWHALPREVAAFCGSRQQA